MVTLEQIQEGLVLPLDKPRQWTSFQAVNKVKAVVRKLVANSQLPVDSTGGQVLPTTHYPLSTKFKIGHAGTLDPLATGLLLVCLGKATKTIPALQDGDKVYTGTMVLGATTPCYDMERAIDQYYPYEHISPALLDEKRKLFEGEIMQVPPMFSAVKIEGQRAYEYARRDDPTVTIQPKTVGIYSFEVTAFRPGKNNQSTQNNQSILNNLSTLNNLSNQNNPPTNHHLYDNPQCVVPEHLPQVDFRIHCGKGTYIRSIARDFGAALGSGAFLSALRREQVGQYTIDKAITIDKIESYFTQQQ